jgi:hypothetical protein
VTHLIHSELLGSIEFTVLIERFVFEKEADLITAVQKIVVPDMLFISGFIRGEASLKAYGVRCEVKTRDVNSTRG